MQGDAPDLMSDDNMGSIILQRAFHGMGLTHTTNVSLILNIKLLMILFNNFFHRIYQGHDQMNHRQTYIIAASQNWTLAITDNLAKKTEADTVLITDKAELTPARLEQINPDIIFFTHWSYIIEPGIYENYECIIFHMTDLPFGRGGSPLQNLISRGIYTTQISAIKCGKGIDAGPVYLKKPLSLHGSAEEIYIRAETVVEEMIVEIVKTGPRPVPQSGEPVWFKRRRPEQGDISALKSLNEVFDYIRMLDAETYPKAFLETDSLRLEFSRAALKKGRVEADVTITFKNKF